MLHESCFDAFGNGSGSGSPLAFLFAPFGRAFQLPEFLCLCYCVIPFRLKIYLDGELIPLGTDSAAKPSCARCLEGACPAVVKAIKLMLSMPHFGKLPRSASRPALSLVLRSGIFFSNLLNSSGSGGSFQACDRGFAGFFIFEKANGL